MFGFGDDNMKEIKLSKQGTKYKGMYVALVDDEDYEKMDNIGWCVLVWKGKPAYARRRIDGKETRMHRFLMGVTDTNVQVDHINGNGLDNRKCNLRIATNAQNQMNVRKNPKRSKGSIYKGVCGSLNRKKWKAFCTINRVRYMLGTFTNEKDAARAYNKFAKETFGEFARLNEID
jgi:hypothetical protein